MKTFFKKNLLYFCTSFLLAILLGVNGCSDNTVTPPGSTPRSDLTRSGKFISFTSNKDVNYDIFIAQVDANGNLATTGLLYPSNPYNLTGGLNALTDKQSNWSPNGRILVFSSKQVSGAEEIWAYLFKADGRIDSSISPNPHLLVNASGKWDENPQFSPDGAYLVWDRREDNQNPPGIDSADFRDLYRGSITYDSVGNISVSAITTLTTTVNGDEYDPKWSPRNSVRRIAYTNKTSATSNDYEIWIMDPLSTTTNSVFYNPNRNGYPAWAPECDRIIFETDHGNSGLFKISYLTYPTYSGNPVDLVQSNTENLRYPSRVPNGNYLAYIRINTLGNGNIYVTTTAGGTGNKLLPASFDNFNNLWPAW